MYHIKKDKRSELSCIMLYEGLKKCMAEEAIEDISVTQLVKAAGVGRATFYRNFDNIIDILNLKSDQVFAMLLEALREYHIKNPVKKSSEFMIPFLKFFDEHTEIVELLMQANRQDIMQESMAKTFKGMYSSYQQVAEDPEDTWDYFVAIRSGITVNILIQWVKDKKRIKPERLGELLFKEIGHSFTVDNFM